MRPKNRRQEHAHQAGLRGCTSVTAVILTVLPQNDRRANLPLREVVSPRHIRIVHEAEDVLGMTLQTLAQSLGIRIIIRPLAGALV